MATPLQINSTGLRRRLGFTLIELVVVMGFLGVMATIAVPRWQAGVDEARVARAVGDIRSLEMAIVTYRRVQREWPDSLGVVGHAGAVDPWGSPYEYQITEGKAGKGVRMDQFLTPLNSDFDLYSIGPDKKSAPALNSKLSHDDIVRANNGRYVGLGALY